MADGKALAVLAGGGILLWSALNGKSVLTTVQNLVKGEKPVPAPLGGSIFPSSGGGSSGAPGGLSPTGGAQTGTKLVSPLTVYKALRHAGVPTSPAIMLTAIAGVESGYNTLAWNQDVNTGDDSVGLFQINYLGSLYGPRVALTGLTPEQLHVGNVQVQADAAAKLWQQSGLQPWGPDISSGKVNQFLGAAQAAASAAGE
jgi:hypothetical protein